MPPVRFAFPMTARYGLPMLVTLRDETASGSVTNELTLDVLDETLTVRELIRSRVYQEVQDFNLKIRTADVAFNGLVQPERVPGVSGRREVDFAAQFKTACDAFERNGFFVLVGDRQAESLDDTVTLKHDTIVSFVKLTPLVGG